jgi:ornithine cyclodeaminase/alanine dehydrogenase-like protein (mu-crystallin family)
MRALVYISDALARRLLTPAAAVDIAEQTLLAHARNQVVWSEPRLLHLSSPHLNTAYPTKACALLGEPMVGLRLTTLPDQHASLPTRLMLLNDPNTGEFVAIMDEEWAHGIRTGAAAAIAAKYLARPDARVVGLVGVGAMNRCALLALHEVFPLDQVRVTSVRRETRAAFAAELTRELGVPVEPFDSVDEVAAEADVLVLSTSADGPLVTERTFRPGMFVYSMGAHQEIDFPLFRAVDKFVADDWEQLKVKSDIRHMLSHGLIGDADIYADLAEVVGGEKPGRERPDERILVRSQGLVTQDTAQAVWVYRRAVEEGLAVPVQLPRLES